MNNIRLSIDLIKVEGSKLVKAPDASGKTAYYVAIPVKSLFVPKESKSVYLTATMIPAPNALYGDFLVKPYINGNTYAHMSNEERNKVPIIGKGTYMEQRLDKEAAKLYEKADFQSVQSMSELPPTESQAGENMVETEGNAPLGVAPFPAESGTPKNLELCVIDDEGHAFSFNDWNTAVQFAAQDQDHRTIIESWRGEKRENRWTFNSFMLSWEKEV